MFMSLDLSTKSTGLAVFDRNKQLIHYELITASQKDPVDRIGKIVAGIKKVFDEYDISAIVVEEVRPETGDIQNRHTEKVLMWLQAAIVFMSHGKAKVDYIYPSQWRSKIGMKTGRGIKREELKKASIAWAKERYGVDVNDDVADAIGIGFGW